MTRAMVLVMLAVSLAASAPVQEQDETEKAFQALWGAQYNRVLASREPADAVALANELLAATQAPGVSSPFVALLCDRAYQLATKHSSGYATAIQAMELLAGNSSDRRAGCLEKIAAVRQRQYDAAPKGNRAPEAETLIEALVAAADAKSPTGSEAEGVILRRALAAATVAGSDRRSEIQTRINRNAMCQRVRKQVADLKRRLEANPQDTAAREEAARLCLVDLDDPAEAATFLDDSCDEAMRKYAPAAAKGVSAAPELASLELGQWYRGLAAGANLVAKPPLLVRSRDYLQRFLELHSSADASRSMVEQALAGVQEELDKLGAAAGPPLNKNLVLGVWFMRQKEGPLLDSRRKPVAIQGDYMWVADEDFERPTQAVEFRQAGAVWPNEPAFMLRTGTITAWVKCAAGGLNPVVCKGLPGYGTGHHDYGIQITGGKLCSYIGWPARLSPLVADAAAPMNRWCFLAFSWDEKRVAFWLDGKAVGVFPIPSPLKLTDGRLEVGIDTPGSTEYFRGRMAAVHLYNVFLNDKQVKDLMKYEVQFMKLRPQAKPAGPGR